MNDEMRLYLHWSVQHRLLRAGIGMLHEPYICIDEKMQGRFSYSPLINDSLPSSAKSCFALAHAPMFVEKYKSDDLQRKSGIKEQCR